MPLALSSSAFHEGGAIPTRYTRDGQNVSPPMEWHGAPPTTRSYVLIVEDPDAPTGTFRHWAVYNIAATTARLPEGASRSKAGDVGQAVNGFRHAYYDGPQPPRGHGLHHYHFRLAALDVPRLDFPGQAKAEDVWAAARPHVIAETELVGTYER
ncbi:YbhB/YbcL family Raf kinase inhibitor-like protein [Microvirga sp. 2TAF3]|uniref:YbhB/YbcL family Raf kinase inhibitor-like protein n=1 Tax=Microvirga sp. 2TAF3 TaxID=3233014 RepID=UPI003F997375